MLFFYIEPILKREGPRENSKAYCLLTPTQKRSLKYQIQNIVFNTKSVFNMNSVSSIPIR
jgi:hypothetical protein